MNLDGNATITSHTQEVVSCNGNKPTREHCDTGDSLGYADAATSTDDSLKNQEIKRTEVVLPPRTPGSTGMSEIKERDLKLEEIHKEIQKKLDYYMSLSANPHHMHYDDGRKLAQDLFHDWELLEQELRKPLYAAIVELEINKDIVINGRVCPISLLPTDWLRFTKLKTVCENTISKIDQYKAKG